MKTKKFEAKTEQEALEMVRDELGLSAIVLSIKKKTGRGFMSMFKKPTVVVTAAYDEGESEKDKVLAAALEAAQEARQNGPDLPDTLMQDPFAQDPLLKDALMQDPLLKDALLQDPSLQDSLLKDSLLKDPLLKDPLLKDPIIKDSLLQDPLLKDTFQETLLKDTLSSASGTHTSGNHTNVEPHQQVTAPQGGNKDLQIAHQQQTIQQLEEMLARLTNHTVSQPNNNEQPAVNYENTMIQMFYESLVAQGVSPEIAVKVLEAANNLDSSAKQDINLLVKIVYNKIIEILGEPRILVGQETGAGYSGATQVVVFMGPTGVGKTTTIAKLSSILLLNHHKQVGLITADTYRIAAVEQLRTYAEIMGLNLKVIYSSDEIVSNVNRLEETHDVILVDTAGRSHHNQDNILELKAMLDFIPSSAKFLVLSVTTRQEDLLSIIKAYESIADFDLIFTKLDETGSLGILLNICYLTGRRVSYVSFGQNVPEDIEKIQPDKIAKSLMGTGFDSAVWGEA